MNFISEDIRMEGTKIHFYKSENDKEPILLLHGGMDNGMCWAPIAEKLSDQYHLIMPDARGHGLTDTLDNDWTYDAMAEDIKKIINFLELEQVNLIGHSMGGNIGAKVAQKYPSLVKKLILEEPGFVVGEYSWFKKLFYKLVMKLYLKLLLRGNLDKIYRKGKKQNPTWPEEEFEPWARSKIQFKNQNPKKLLNALNNPYDWKEIVKGIECPTLLLTGEDGIVGDEFAKKVLEVNNNFKWVKIEGAGHNIRRENPEDFLSAVQFFLQD